ETAEAERGWVDDRSVAGDDVGHEPAGAGTDAEAMAGEAGRHVESRQRIDRRDYRHLVGGDIDHAGPAFDDRRAGKEWEGGRQVAMRLVEDLRRRRRIEHTHLLERRGAVEGPAPRRPPLLDEAV